MFAGQKCDICYTCFTGKKGSTRPRGEACRRSNDKSSSSEKAVSADFMSTSPLIVTRKKGVFVAQIDSRRPLNLINGNNSTSSFPDAFATVGFDASFIESPNLLDKPFVTLPMNSLFFHF